VLILALFQPRKPRIVAFRDEGLAMETNRVLLISAIDRYSVCIVENGVATQRHFRVESFAASWALGQSLRLGVSVLRESATPPATVSPSPGQDFQTSNPTMCV